MASDQAAAAVRWDLCQDNEKKRVVLAEASGDFIDVLFSFLTLPLGTIVRLLGNSVEMGNIKKLYDSVKRLGSDVFWNDICKQMLLNPRNPLEASCQRLKVKVDDTKPTEYFMCHSCSAEKNLLLSTFDGGRCYCGKLMRKNMDLLVESKEETAAENGVFVKGDAKFLIFDDLTVLRSTPSKSVQKFLEHRRKDLKIPTISKDVDMKEILSILKQALISKSPLSEVLFEKEGSKSCSCPYSCPCSRNTNPIHWKDSIKIKVMVNKSNNKILLAEADGDFVDFLFSFLTTPLGSILNLTNGKFPLGSIGNLYRSVKRLDPSWFKGSSKESLLNLRVAPHFGCKSSPFQEDHTPNYWYGTVAGNDNNEGRTMISKKKDMLQTAKELKLFDPRCSDGAKEPGVGFVKRPCLFVVMDDLEVKQMTTTSSIEYLNNLGDDVKLGDLEEHLVEIRSNEVMNLLRASLTSNEATLTRSLGCLLMKWKCQRCIPFWGTLQWMKKRHRKKKENGQNSCNILCCCSVCDK
ncbi:hypothetical protein GLYMA_07G064900v4 [Glycine max]|uniref:DUF674 family protein n=1 Tax=Glycine max TaxID=3847 RepID=I1KI31_SOYBN|nr:uncharacterized protein LOC100809921 [Glycine max]XP_040873233.1 uncharacterized protein LOC100809921 [Glycine max]KRH48043.1 hypothetical protein GLYMA_07G064900v4 [Glycine max]|eukprot:XP_003529915.1 uncharacterized protein LOC100809921 [Glycine max]